MSIQALWSKFKSFLSDPEILLTVLIITVALGSFLLGRLSVSNIARTDAHIAATAQSASPPPASAATVPAVQAEQNTDAPHEGGYVASKNGTKYHLPWCSGAKRIKEENKVFFDTKEEAEAAGYTPAANCKGI